MATPTPNTISPTIQPNTQVDIWSGVNWEKVAIAGLFVVVAVLAVGLAVVWRRLPKK
ncbi:MAG: hypothetical protein ACQCN4_07110 [Candidatus Bathyarchaeia archaeon]|jgi:hypothetical protein